MVTSQERSWRTNTVTSTFPKQKVHIVYKIKNLANVRQRKIQPISHLVSRVAASSKRCVFLFSLLKEGIPQDILMGFLATMSGKEPGSCFRN